MSISARNTGVIFNTFINLTKELEPFVKTDDLKIAFDKDGKVYLLGDDFTEVINANFAAVPDIKNSIRVLIAKYRSPYKPEKTANNYSV
jgi:hypothetical protein